MGTRLYPVSKDNAVIEKLVGVPAGSVEGFKKFQEELLKKFPDTNEPVIDQNLEPGYLRWEAINDHPVYGILDHFDTYGWGKFDMWILKFHSLDTCAGQTTDAKVITELLSSTYDGNSPDSNQVKLLVDTGGVCWG